MLIKAVTLQTSIALVTVLFVAVILTLTSRIWFSTTSDHVRLIVEPVMIPAAQDNTVKGARRSTTHSLYGLDLQSARVSRLKSQNKKTLLQQSSDTHLDESNEIYNVYHDQTQNATKSLTASLGPPISKPQNCHKHHCQEYLNEQELLAMRSCFQQTALRTVNGQLNLIKSMIRENNCNFMDGAHRRPVALASTEGSGNTWVRGLLEKSTGICTGFLYCDYVMRKEGFIGEMIKSGSVLVVKTHTLIPQWYGEEYVHPKRDEPFYGSAVYILRNPYKSLIAEWNRRATNGIIKKEHLPHNESHTNVVPKEYYGIPRWDKFFHKYIESWKSRLVNWVLNSTDKHPVHVVRYEDLKTNTSYEISKILTFLGIPYSYEDLHQRLHEDFTKFKRQHTNDNFEHYSNRQKQHIKSVLLDTIKLVEVANKANVLKLQEYLPGYCSE